MDLFESYELELNDYRKNVISKIDQISSLSGRNQMEEIHAVEETIQEAASTIQAMRYEKENVPSYERETVNAKIAAYEQEIQSWRRDLQKARSPMSAEAARNALFDGATSRSSFNSLGEEHRNRVEDTATTYGRAGDALAQAKMLAEESLEIGIDTMSDLEAQRETIDRSANRLGNVNEHIGTATTVMRSISRRLIQNKILLFVIAAILALTILAVIILAVWLKAG